MGNAKCENEWILEEKIIRSLIDLTRKTHENQKDVVDQVYQFGMLRANTLGLVT